MLVECHILPTLDKRTKLKHKKGKEMETIFTWEILTFLIPARIAYYFALGLCLRVSSSTDMKERC